jgi:tetratricopeptide (TPR) repeat protein
MKTTAGSVGTSDASSDSRISIANKEKQNVFQKWTSLPPSRNDALIWLARTLIEQNEMGEAAGLINTLQLDPNLPKRLHNDLDDLNAYWFYRQNSFDSAAAYLEKALSTADNKQDLSRSEFLLAQMYELTHQFDKADAYYKKVSGHTVNPLLDIHARLNNAKMLKSTNPEELANGINMLVQMTKKDKFEFYRDILFYSAGELAMQQPDTSAAIGFFTKSIEHNENDVVYWNKAYLQLADIAYNQGHYKNAFAFYDSLQTGDTTLKDRLPSIQSRRNALVKIVEKINVLEREDSLQTLAALPANERDARIQKMVRKLRRERGLKEDENNVAGAILGFYDTRDNIKDEPVDLFPEATKDEWYFNNAAKKQSGLNDFKRRWGPRKNVDNWARNAAAEVAADNLVNQPDALAAPDDIDKPAELKKTGRNKDLSVANPGQDAHNPAPAEDISFEAMMANVPLTPEKMAASNSLVAANMYELGWLLQNELEEYQRAIDAYDHSLSRFPDSLYDGELYLNLSFCYSKLGNTQKADYYKNLVLKNFAESRAALVLNNPAAANANMKDAEGTKRYESIYNLFIEGNFDQAFREKKAADSIYGNSYWSPQLLYIEAVYHIKQHDDSTAIAVLSDIITLYPEARLAPKATRMISVLRRRAEIEDYLTKLEITRAKDDEIVKIEEKKVLKRDDLNLIKSPVRNIDTTRKDMKPAPITVKDSLKVTPPPVVKDTVKKIVPPVVPPPVKDSVKKAPTTFVNGPFQLNTDSSQNVIMLMNKVDGTYVNESKNAFARYLGESFRGEPIVLTRDAIDKDLALLVFSSFKDAPSALQFLQKIRKAAPDEVSWLPAGKYSFYLINDENLQILKANKDIEGYKGLLKKVYPGIF